MLSGFMIKTKIKATYIAVMCAFYFKTPEAIKANELVEDIKLFQKKHGEWVPEIAKLFLETVGSK